MKLLHAGFLSNMLPRSVQFFGALAGGVLLLAIVEYLPRPAHTQFWDRIYDTGHLLVFGLFVCFVLKMASAVFGAKKLPTQYLISMLLSLAVGLAVEVWQHGHGRSAEWIDAFSDLMGIAAFSAVYAAFDNRIPLPRSAMLRRDRLLTIATLLVAVGLVPLWKVCQLYRARERLLPQLIDFEQPWNHKFYYAQASSFSVVPPPESWPEFSRPTAVARLRTLPDADFPGFVFLEPYPNWTAYKMLEMDVLYEEEMPQVFVLRIHDAWNNHDVRDRFRKEILLRPGFQTIRVDLDDVRAGPWFRDLDLSRINGLAFYTYGLDRRVTFFLGQIRLVD